MSANTPAGALRRVGGRALRRYLKAVVKIRKANRNRKGN